MKTTTVLLFSALSLAACATDEQQDLDVIDRGGEGHTQVDNTVAGEGGEWIAEQLQNDPRQKIEGVLDGHANDWIELQVRGPRFPTIDGQSEDWTNDIIRGPRPVEGLDDKVVQEVRDIIRAPRSVEEIDDKLNGNVQPARNPDGLDGHIGEYGEDILVNGRNYTLIHGPSGSHYLIDALGNSFVINGPIGPRR